MFESKYSKVLTVILIIVIIAIVGLLGFLGYDYYQKYIITKDTSDFVDNFQGEVTDDERPSEDTPTEEDPNDDTDDPLGNVQDAKPSTGTGATATYQGFNVLRNN